MNLKHIKNYNLINKSTCHENYFQLAPNYSFTSLSLKRKRVLAFLLTKLIMIPSFNKQVFEILSYLLQSYDIHQEKIEEDLCDV